MIIFILIPNYYFGWFWCVQLNQLNWKFNFLAVVSSDINLC